VIFKRRRIAEPTLQEQLTETKAKFARAKLLPDSAFTITGQPYVQAIRHGVDEKPKRVAELEAEIAYLEVKIKEEDKHD
jgi:hypothetical protein